MVGKLYFNFSYIYLLFHELKKIMYDVGISHKNVYSDVNFNKIYYCFALNFIFAE